MGSKLAIRVLDKIPDKFFYVVLDDGDMQHFAMTTIKSHNAQSQEAMEFVHCQKTSYSWHKKSPQVVRTGYAQPPFAPVAYKLPLQRFNRLCVIQHSTSFYSVEYCGTLGPLFLWVRTPEDGLKVVVPPSAPSEFVAEENVCCYPCAGQDRWLYGVLREHTLDEFEEEAIERWLDS